MMLNKKNQICKISENYKNALNNMNIDINSISLPINMESISRERMNNYEKELFSKTTMISNLTLRIKTVHVILSGDK